MSSFGDSRSFRLGDYISLYQQQRQQLHRRYQEKDDYIKQLAQDRSNLQVMRDAFLLEDTRNLFQRKLSELERLLLGGLNQPSTSIPAPSEPAVSTPPTTHPDAPTDENGIRFLVELVK